MVGDHSRNLVIGTGDIRIAEVRLDRDKRIHRHFVFRNRGQNAVGSVGVLEIIVQNFLKQGLEHHNELRTPEPIHPIAVTRHRNSRAKAADAPREQFRALLVGSDNACQQVVLAVFGSKGMVVLADDHNVVVVVDGRFHRLHHTLPQSDSTNRMLYGINPRQFKFFLPSELRLDVLPSVYAVFEVDDLDGKVKIAFGFLFLLFLLVFSDRFLEDFVYFLAPHIPVQTRFVFAA